MKEYDYTNLDEVRQFVDSHTWFHTIDLGEGILTPGAKSQTIIGPESEAIFRRLNLRGCSVMDVGAWNGFYTVEAKRRGAREVLAVDSPTWLSPSFRGKETFDFVMQRLGLTVQTRILDLDVQDISEADVGYWDVVLFLGVFYHLFDPIAALRKLAAIANEVLVIETHLDLGESDRPAMVFYPGSELNDDPSNWWGPNRAAVEAVLRTSGFERVEFTVHPAPGHETTRGIFHAYKSEEAFLWHTGVSAHFNEHAASGEARPRVERRADHPLNRAEVRALYEILLGRSAESQQVIDMQLGMHRSAISLAHSFCDSDEFRAHVTREGVGRITRTDVKSLYKILLGRPPESDEVIETHRRAHTSTVSLALAICGSEEAYSRSAGLVGAPPTKAEILALYETLFRQTPESDEIVEELLQPHRSSISLARWLCRPDQVRLRTKNEADHADIRAIYQIVLGRQPESEEAVETHLSLQEPVASLARALCDTDEFRERLRREAKRPLKRAEVRQLYEIILGRKAESSEVIENQLREHDSAISLARSLCQSEEFALRLKGDVDRWLEAASSAYLGYRAEDLAIFDQFAGAAPQPAPGFVTDFHGSRARISCLWDGVQHLDGVVLSKPVPGDYHAETAEWLGVLKAVLAADGRFAAMELGAGTGPWLVASSTAARLRGIRNIRLLGVEADPSRFASMQQNFRDNGIDPDEHVLLCGGVSVVSGKAKWPRSADPRNVAGGRPVRRSQINDESLDERDLDYLEGMTDDLVDVDLIAFEELLGYEPLWDLVHLDVQGTEVELCAACLTMLSRCVRYLVVGTHSRKLDGDLLDLMFHAGWVLEHEKPVRFVFNRQLRTLERMTSADGIQVWRNPDL